MKLQSLSIIFIIIILPISMVLSEYVSNKIQTNETELLYNNRLLNSTYDAIKAYQLNTVNNAFGDVTTQKVKDVEAAGKTFYNSLTSNFNYTGYRSEVMKEYVPAVVFTMYDGYYTYSPFQNTLTEMQDGTYDESYSEDGKTHEGLKPYVYYACRYIIDNDSDFSIIYTLDNYITIQGKIKGKFVYDNGYLYTIGTTKENGLYKDGNTYWYNGVKFTEDDTEEMKEYVGNDLYSYVKINGKKYYLDENYYTSRSGDVTYGGITFKASSGIFYIDSNGNRNYSQTKGYSPLNPEQNNDEFVQYYKAIKRNKSAFEYYKNAYEFSSMVLGSSVPGGEYKDKGGTSFTEVYGLNNLKTTDAAEYNKPSVGTNATPLNEYGDFKIFESTGTSNIENASSNFNQHRKAIIRYVVETNLSTSISAFSSSATTNFLMPKISENDWETIENDVCAISFLQGLNIGSKKYNGYAVVANTLTKEYIDESDIYILTTENTYCKVNDKTLQDVSKIETKANLGYYPGVWKLNFEQKQGIIQSDGSEKTVYYNPVRHYGSYTSIMGSYGIESIEGKDMYTYVNELENITLKKAYLMALGRERWGAYNVNNINYELYGNTNGNIYFLKSY